MNEFFNWNDTLIVFQHNWFWMLVAAAIGVWIGIVTCDTSTEN
jgi:hypothetical protein